MASSHLALRTRTTALLVLPFAALLSSCDNPAGSDTGAPAVMDIVSGDLQTGTVATELPQALVVRVVDDKGKPVEGQVLNFRVTAGGGSVFAGAALTNAQGEARERWTLGTVAGDTQRVEARAVDPSTGQALVFATFRAVGRADAPAAIAPMGESVRSGTAGMPMADSLAVRVLDRFGNGVAGATVVWTVQRGGGTVSPGTSTADAHGVAKAQWTLGTFVAEMQIAQAAAAVGLSTAFLAQTGVPPGATLVIRGGDGQTGTVGTQLPQPVKVALLLSDGRPVVGAVVAWSLGSTGGSVSSATAVTDANGEAETLWTLPTVAGTASLWAETPGAVAVPFTATAAPGAAVSLVLVSGTGQFASPGVPVADSLVVRAVDADGNAVPGIAVSWTTSSGTLSPASATTRADGTARTQWTPATRGESSATATAPGLPEVTFTTLPLGSMTMVFGGWGSTIIVDTLYLAVQVRSTYEVAGVTATVGSRSLAMQKLDPSNGSFWRLDIPLTGLPAGPHQLSLRATDVAGTVADTSTVFILDRQPTIEFLLPTRGSVWPAGGTVRVVAVCRDDAPAGCTRLEVSTGTGPVAVGTDSVDALMATGSPGDSVTVWATAYDARSTSRVATTYFLVENRATLTEVAAVNGQVLDYGGPGLLYQDGAGELRIRPAAGGPEATIPTPGTDLGREQWKLTPRGALYTRGPLPARIYEWRDGTVVDLGEIGTQEVNGTSRVAPIVVEGKWAVWSGPGGLARRDLDAGASTVVYSGGEVGGYDVGPNGNVTFSRRLASSSPWEIMWYQDGNLTPLASGAWAGGPRTDGTFVVATVNSSVVLLGGGTLATGTAALPVIPEYDVVEGWTAYTRRPGPSTSEVWLRSPTGAGNDKVSSTFDAARLRAVGPGGQVVFAASGSLWLKIRHTKAVEVASDTGTLVWRNGEPYLIVGDRVFRVQR